MTAVTERMKHTTAVCSQLAENVTTQTPSSKTSSRSPSDRSLNIVIFGVAEDRTATVWRHKVDSALDSSPVMASTSLICLELVVTLLRRSDRLV